MKYLQYLILIITALAFSSCNDDADVMDPKLIKGRWELISQNSSGSGYIYDFTTQSEHTWSWGTLTTYYITEEGYKIHDKVFDWHVSDPNNDDVMYLEITLLGELDSDDLWENTDYYIVERLTASEMVIRKSEVGDTHTRLRFVRRNDL